MAEYRGSVDTIIFRNDDNGYCVMLVKPDQGKAFTAVGVIPYAQEGDLVSLSGEWVEHGSYGTQLKVSSFSFATPQGRSEIEKYLSSGFIHGIGAPMAHRIVRLFGDKTIEIMDAQPERLLEVEGIGPKTLKKIVASYSEHRTAQNAIMYFLNLGISPSLANRIYEKYGSDAVLVSKTDPYRLCDEIRGIGFVTADRIAFGVGFKPGDEHRLASGIRYVLEESLNNDGHTYLPESTFLSRACEILGVNEEVIQRAAQRLALQGKIIYDQVDGENCVFSKSAYDCELDIANRLHQLIRRPVDPDSAPKVHTTLSSGIELSPAQVEALETALKNRVCVITGGPGTGKTTLIRGIIESLQKDRKIALAAPTGRAAKRMSEATGLEAMTIHRLLEYGQGEDELFNRNESAPLKQKIVIVDEMSMVDIFLMRALLRALKPDAHLILTGDSDQLPSVGAGNVLKDIISSGSVPVIRLTEIFRQSRLSDIVLNAHRINRGEMPVVNGKGSDFFLERCESASRAAEGAVELVKTRLPRFMKLDPVKDIQVMAPMKRGEAGVFAMNELLQQHLNPPSDKKPQLKRGQTVFRLSDKVMQTRNDYSACWTRAGEEGSGVFNGDIGYITEVDSENKLVTVRFEDERLCVYDREMLEDLELAYCMSVHKSQGCEFPCIVLPLVGGPPMLMTRNLLYTAVTRARKLVVIIGRSACVQQMVNNNHIQSRFSSLCFRLKELSGIFGGNEA